MRSLCGIILILFLFSCQNSGTYKTISKEDANGFKYETVKGDPLNARIYTLENGLKVYLAQNHDKPKIMTLISVRAGSTNDPRETTGLAHYFEHIMFKGTDELGTINWEEESKLIAHISDLFEKRKNTDDLEEKTRIYKQIDSLSLKASTYCVASEYDKVVGLLGARYTNAFTDYETTTYMNEVPANELMRWLKIERERFQDPVMRLFHTELETVYEEFNMYQDYDDVNADNALKQELFKNHPYGVDIIGHGEHLKNPSMVNIQNFKDTYYVANNMAICLMGDLNFEETIKLINEEWGSFASNPNLPELTFEPEDPINEVVEKDVFGPDQEFITIGFRTPNNKSQESKYLQYIDMLLNNSQAGLIDLDLVKNQKVQKAYSNFRGMNDYGVFELIGYPRKGQTLDEVKELLLAELDKIKKGEFEEWLMDAVINDLKFRNLKQYESNWGVFAFMESFIANDPWVNTVKHIDELNRISKEELVKFANEFFNDNCVIVYKRTGENKNKMLVEKPPITPFDVNRDQESKFLTDIKSIEIEDIKPQFLDFENDIEKEELAEGIEYFYTHNPKNNYANVSYIIEMGKNHSKTLPLAVNYLKYIGTDRYSFEELSKEFYKIGIRFRVSTGDERSVISIYGLDENIDKGIELLEHVLSNAKADKESYDKYVEGILKNRSDAKLDKGKILWRGMYNYAKYGAKSAFTNVFSEDELINLDPNVLTAEIKNVLNFKHRILYYGPRENEEFKIVFLAKHDVNKKFEDIQEPVYYAELDNIKTEVYFCNYDMVQAQIILLSKDSKFDAAKLSDIKMFNEYYGGSMGSIVFQEMREARGLAYTAFASYSTPNKLYKSNYIFGFIGTQPDKIDIALNKFDDLLNNMPKSEKAFNGSKEAIIKKINSERIIKDQIVRTYLRNKDLGIETDYRKEIYDHVNDYTLEELSEFFNETIKGKKYNILVLGNKDKIDFNMLSKYGKIQELTLEEVFNY
ncbi:MAG: insulinase family protein [Bacteroidales bacterium]|nr:insulinase family protein [Bacteroidales bacterium]